MRISFGWPMLKISPAAVGRIHQRDERVHHVVDVGEAARLLAVAVDAQRLVAQRPAHEARHDHAVATRLARPDGVEQAHHGHGSRRSCQ